MSTKNFHNTIPLAPLKIAALGNYWELGQKVSHAILKRRLEAAAHCEKPAFMTAGYQKNNYLIDFDCPRFGTGEGKAVIHESIRGTDLYIIADLVNHHESYKMFGRQTQSSPDDLFTNLKRIIMACHGSPRRITVIMPYLYEGRQHIRLLEESLDCALALQELADMGAENIITFDAHDDRVQNAIPNHGFDNFYTSYQFIQKILNTQPDITIDEKHFAVVSPDEGGVKRAVYYAELLGVDMGMFYRRLDYSKTINDRHPVADVAFLGKPLAGKDVIILDDMIASGKTMLEAAKKVRKQNARKIFLCATFGLFSDGIENFDLAYKEGLFDCLYTTNLCHCPDRLFQKPYYHNVDLSDYIALIIDTLNHNTSVNEILDATGHIQKLIQERNKSI